MSMDFVYDLTEKFQEQGIDYFLITVRKGKKKDAADVFYHLKDEESAATLARVLLKLSKDESLTEVFEKKNNASKPSKKKKPKKTRGRPRKREDEGEDEK